jgi:hypothetical protein
MPAIEFTSEPHNGMIAIPEQYKDWFKKPVRVMLWAIEPSWSEKITQKSRPLPKGAGCYHSGRSDISMRAEELWFPMS